MKLGVAKRVREGEKPAPTRVYSKKQETAVAEATGGRRTPNSGATMFGGKGDVLTTGKNGFLLECKTKTAPSESISIKKEWFSKNREECMSNGTPHQAIHKLHRF